MDELIARLGQLNIAVGELNELTADFQPGQDLYERRVLLDGLAVKLDEIRTSAVLALELVDKANLPTAEEEQALMQEARALLDQMPDHYQPYELTHNERGYMLRIDYTMIFQGVPALEALTRTKRYIAERERKGWDLPTGVIDGIFD